MKKIWLFFTQCILIEFVLRRCFTNSQDDFTELSTVEDDKKVFDLCSDL